MHYRPRHNKCYCWSQFIFLKRGKLYRDLICSWHCSEIVPHVSALRHARSRLLNSMHERDFPFGKTIVYSDWNWVTRQHSAMCACKKCFFFYLDPRQYRNIPVPLVKASIFVGSDSKNKTNKPKTTSYRVHFPRLYLCILNVISEISGTLPGRRPKGRKSGENERAGLGFICVDNRE